VGRLDKLPPYLFSAIDAAKNKARAQGVQVIDLGVGDPDLPTPEPLVRKMVAVVAQPQGHRYPAGKGGAGLRQAIAQLMQKRYKVKVDPDTQVLVLIGSKEGLGHLPLSCVEEGDNTLVPDLGYPVYGQATLLAGGEPRAFPLKAENGFLPDLDHLAGLIDDRSRLLFLNYPNNPTGAVAGPAFWREVTDLAKSKDLVLVNDAAYQEVTFTAEAQTSLLQVADCNTDRVIELHSFSKMFNMTGWRIAFAVGHAEVISDLARVKESMDSGVFTPVQDVATYALGDDFDTLLAGVMAAYPPRREIIEKALRESGYEIYPSGATFYVWVKVPAGYSSMDFCSRALQDIGVVITPGNGFGTGGEGWFRISLTASDTDIAEGARRIREWQL
jgi:LL-diaminopimelate aminotransferase